VILPLLILALVGGGLAHMMAGYNEVALMEAEATVDSRTRTILDFPQQFALGGPSITRAWLENIRDRGVLSGPEFLLEAGWRNREDVVRTRAAIALIMLAAVQGDIAGMPRDLAGLKSRREATGGELTEEEEKLVTQARVILSGLRHVQGRAERERLLKVYRAGLAKRVLPTRFLDPEDLVAQVRRELGWEEPPEPVAADEPEVEEPAPEAAPELEPVAEPESEMEPEPEPETEPVIEPLREPVGEPASPLETSLPPSPAATAALEVPAEAEPAPELEAAPEVEPEGVLKDEPDSAPASEASTEPESAPASESTTEPASAPAGEVTTEP
jgi:hypothetical protein